MKKIEIEINDETAEAIDRVISSRYYRNYPIGQAYSLLIGELVSELQKAPPCCCSVPPHCHPPSWCVSD